MKSSHHDLQCLFIVTAEGCTITLDASVAFSLRNFCSPHVPATVNLTWEKDGFQFWCFPHLSIVSLKGISYIIWQKACLAYQKDLIDISTQWTQFWWHHAFRQPFVFSTLLTSWMPVTGVVPPILYAFFPFFMFFVTWVFCPHVWKCSGPCMPAAASDPLEIVTHSCELPRRCWDLNLGPLQVQSTAASALSNWAFSPSPNYTCPSWFRYTS